MHVGLVKLAGREGAAEAAALTHLLVRPATSKHRLQLRDRRLRLVAHRPTSTLSPQEAEDVVGI
jgi:hypothetical protein